MPVPEQRVVLITGASSGIGRACASHLHELGYRVYGASRRGGEAGSDPFTMMPMDVDDDASVIAGIQQISEREGRIDVVINNAGFGIAGAAEDTTLEEAKAQMETNFFGMVRACRAVLPTMRAQGSGRIINISSIGGLIGIPFQAHYSAAKFALEGFTEALRMEVKPHGIRVVTVEPGDLKTGFTAARRRTAESATNVAYTDRFERALAVMEHDEQHGPGPEVVAKLIGRILRSGNPRPRYVVGPAFEMVVPTLKKILPPRLFEWGLMKYYKMD